VAYGKEAQYVGQIEQERKKGEYSWKRCQNHIGSIRSFLKRKKLRGWHLEEPSTTPSTLKKGPNPLGVQFTQCRHTS